MALHFHISSDSGASVSSNEELHDRLVCENKAHKKSSRKAYQGWLDFLDSENLLTRDPALHKAALLQKFLDTVHFVWTSPSTGVPHANRSSARSLPVMKKRDSSVSKHKSVPSCQLPDDEFCVWFQAGLADHLPVNRKDIARFDSLIEYSEDESACVKGVRNVRSNVGSLTKPNNIRNGIALGDSGVVAEVRNGHLATD